jgi:hypothetical protein
MIKRLDAGKLGSLEARKFKGLRASNIPVNQYFNLSSCLHPWFLCYRYYIQPSSAALLK